MIQLEPGMRVRCVNAKWHISIEDGAEYVVDRMKDDTRVHLRGHEMAYYANRFKPIVRVKAKCVPSLSVLIKRAVAAVERMTPAERAAMDKAQRESWARGEAGLGLD